jgi:hypothetical protein
VCGEKCFAFRRREVREDLWEVRNAEFQNLNSSPVIFLVIKSKRVSWEGEVVHVEERRGACGFLAAKHESAHLEG